ncbi:transporter substrate-binding domain-containing protein [Epidermidibacterium keratini]|uniref:Transporter substrate-binding domain-containing protein n=1 Tax=Epidermidibacterium keratini TaxID=1891644 RepID=A0A7L4YQU1_9ACTN|nr:glutamate ABC transporter substrate-binding protein [Epidermidibacterium keratini]QHC01490.1 transporter substrate-binding domain-containing protein [Epidermidibacterium keratini]
MRKKLAAVAAVAAMALALTGCGKADDSGSGSEPSVDTSASFEAGSTMETINKAGTIKIGVKFDQPGLGYKDPAKGDVPEGFDIEVAKYVAGKLGIPGDQIEWVEAISSNREPFIQNGTVDIVVASYSITDQRKQVVGMAGPYYVTGQQLLVKKDDDSIKGPEDLSGKGVCSVDGSTSIKTVAEKYGAAPKPAGTYSECVQALQNGTVDAVTTDGPILLGYAAQDPDNLKVVGDPFSEERYGIGFKLGDTAMCEFLTDTINEMVDDDSWKTAFDDTLGKADVEAPEPPKTDSCS